MDLVGVLGNRVLAPAARPAHSDPARVIERAISDHNARGAVERITYKAAIGIDILTAPPLDAQPQPLTTRHCD